MALRRRIVICVDGTWNNMHGQEGNTYNVFRIWASVKKSGEIVDQNGNRFEQIAKYFPGVGVVKGALSKLHDGATGAGCEKLIEEVYKFCCDKIKSCDDELWFFGFSRGAYVVRAVAVLLHDNGFRGPLKTRRSKLRSIMNVGLQKFANQPPTSGQDDQVRTEHIRESPCIRFLGLFDTVQMVQDKYKDDISHVNSIKQVRHAMALNEHRSLRPLESYSSEEDEVGESDGSILQAWFVGAHKDMGGGAMHDGLSLYPLQWMLMECMNQGLVLEYEFPSEMPIPMQDPLEIVFPSPPEYSEIGSQTGLPDMSHPNANAVLSPHWDFIYSNGLTTSMRDLRRSHRHGNLQKVPRNKLVKKGSTSQATHTHMVRMNSGVFNELKLGERSIFGNEIGDLLGYNESSKNGTFIHPSVYFLSDTYTSLGVTQALKTIRVQLDSFQAKANLKYVSKGIMDTGYYPWIKDFSPSSTVPNCRVLICGNTGVGKSRLLNRVFGFQMTSVSDDRKGMHDIYQGFESDDHPGIIIHDSEGFQTGSKNEVKAFEKFMKDRSGNDDPSENLQAIWLCIESNTKRPVQAALASVLKTVAKVAPTMPIVVVGTKKDELLSSAFTQQRLQAIATGHGTLEELETQKCMLSKQEAIFRTQFETNEETAPFWFKLELVTFTFVLCETNTSPDIYDESSVRHLIRTTVNLIDDTLSSEGIIAAGLDIDLKIDLAVKKTLTLLRRAIVAASLPLPGSSMVTTPTISRLLCDAIVTGCFGMSKSKAAAMEQVLNRVIAVNLAPFMAQSLAQMTVVWGGVAALTVFTLFGGIPLAVGATMIEAPAAARMVIKCACDLIIILAGAFRDDWGGKFVGTDKIETVAQNYKRAKQKFVAENSKEVECSRRRIVHRQLNDLVPLVSALAIQAHQERHISKYTEGMKNIIEKYRFVKNDFNKEREPLNEAVVSSVRSDSLEIPEDQEEMHQFLSAHVQ